MLDTAQLKYAKSDMFHLIFSGTGPKKYCKYHEFFLYKP